MVTLENNATSWITSDPKTYKRIEFNYRKNKEQDNTEAIDSLTREFDYSTCRNEYWNPEPFSLLYGTPLWHEASVSQRVLLNQLYWVAYYSQIISAEIATIFFNQTAAAALYGIEDFRIVCDTLDLESAQERAHINSFKKISEQVEAHVFGRRLFTYPMRTPYAQTMIFTPSGPLRDFWRRCQLKTYTVLSSSSAFIGCQYFTVRGVRTLNGKLVQHKLSNYYTNHHDKASAPIPSRISYHHFLDESFHFNSSLVISHDVLRSVGKPTLFERMVANTTLHGTQRDHFHFSSAINGLFWYDPALYGVIYQVLTSPHFGLDGRGAREMMRRCFCEDSDGTQASFQSRNLAIDSYKEYLDSLDYIDDTNRYLKIMSKNSLRDHFKRNQSALNKFHFVEEQHENSLRIQHAPAG